MLVVVTLHRAVSRLVLVDARRAHEHRGHHGERAEGARHHVAHHVAVVVLAGPDEAALGADHPRHRVVDERIKVLDAQGVEGGLILGVEDGLEDVLEGVVVLLGDGVLGGEPQVLFGVNGVLEAGTGEGGDGAVLVVLPLEHAGALKVVDGLAEFLLPVRAGEHQLGPAGAGHPVLGAPINVAVGVACDGDGMLPGLDHRGDAPDHDRGAEHGAVQDGADGAVGRLPLVPMNRGILVTAYASLTKDVTYEEVKAAYDKYYKDEFFVRVLNKDVCPQTRNVEGSNFVDVNFKIDPRTKRVIMMGAIDNLVKGAAGQAVQNMNLMFGFDENEGLKQIPMCP